MKKTLVISVLLLLGLGSFGQELKLGLPLGHTSEVYFSTFSPDGKTILTASGDYTARLWDVASGKLINSLEGHSSVVYNAVFSPDGNSILTASGDKTARLWETNTGRLKQTFEGHSKAINFVAFGPRGRRILTASEDHSARLWDVSSGKEIISLKGHTRGVKAAAFSPNGKNIITASDDNTARLWNATSGALIHILAGHQYGVSSALFSPDGKSVLTASDDKTARLWSLDSGKLIHSLQGHRFPLTSAVFSPDARQILTASGDYTARLWDATSGKLMEVLQEHTLDVSAAVFSPDGKRIITTSLDRTACIWATDSARLLHTLRGHSSFVNSAHFSPDGKSVVTAAEDHTTILWDVASGKARYKLRRHTAVVNTAIFSPDGNSIITSAEDRIARLWDANSGKLNYSFKGHSGKLRSASFSPDGKSILTTSEDRTARLWSADSGTLIHVLRGHSSKLRSGAFSPDGNSIITASDDNTAILWDASSGKLLRKLQGHRSKVSSAAFSPDGRMILTASDDNTARLWGCDSGNLLVSLEGHSDKIYSAVFSPDGMHILTASWDKTARLWEAATGNLLHTLRGHTAWVSSATFSPDGKSILTASWDKTVGLWDAASGRLIHILEGHTARVASATFSRDGKSILTASWDKSVGIWDAVSGKRIGQLEGHTDRVLSAVFSPDGESILTASEDGSTCLWDRRTGTQLIHHFIFDGDPEKWVHLHPSGLFDASQEAMNLMYWTKGLEVIDFEQLKYYFFEPGLWEKAMNRATMREVPNIKELKLHPQVRVGEIKDGLIPVTFIKRDGGFGDITLSINGVEVSTETVGRKVDTTLEVQTVYYSVKDHPRLVNGANSIVVSAASKGNIVQGRGTPVVAEFDEAEYFPQFYGVVIGINEYANPRMNLNFPVKDAMAISKSMELAANNLFTEGVHIYTITSETEIKPNKESISKVFKDISKTAKADDIILVHLSGHGMTVGDGLNNEFYFLTADATSTEKEAYSLDYNREKQTISTSEWVNMLQSVNANKRIMIIDACGSGQVVDELIAQRDVAGSQIKAIDRMKDRTGMFIISGSSADAVSYEASRYGQGLLTYSILQAMKGAALKENKYVDVETIFNYARETVPVLARGIGGIQKPQLLKPKGGSFDIGIMEEQDRAAVPLAEPKKVFVRSILVHKTKYRDVLNIGKRLNEELSLLASRGRGNSVVFFDAEEYSSGCKITGGYLETDNGISIDLTIICDEEETMHSLSASNAKELVEKIITLVTE